MSRQIDLREYLPAEYPLTPAQRDLLLEQKRALTLTIEPVAGRATGFA